MKTSTALLTLALLALVPSSLALAGGGWKTQLKHRPRVAFDGRDAAHVQRVAARINGQQDPWAQGYRRLRDLAETGQTVRHGASGWKSKPDSYAVLYGQETRNGEIAAAKATVAWLYSKGVDPTWRPLPRLPGQATPEGWVKQQAREAREIVAGMFSNWPGWRGFKVINRGIVMADSLTMHCVAYDMLEALPASWRGSLTTPRKRLGDLASDARFYWRVIDTYNSNHSLRVAGGLGIAAITLNDLDRYRWFRPGTWWHRPKGWIKKAERAVHPTHRKSDLVYQARKGAFAEGTSYYHYALDLALPFCLAHARFVGQGGVGFMRSNTVNDLLQWGVDLRLPDGRRGQVDNARLFKDSLPAYLLTRLPHGARSTRDREVALWDLKRSGFPGFGGRRATFLLGAYDPESAWIATADAWTGLPRTPTRYLDRQGSAVLRTDWGPSAAQAIVQAQHGELRKRGGGHESVDNGSYVFYAHGDLITIDPGYFGFSKVKATYRGKHRSMVLVNGKAPKPAHKWLGFGKWRSGGKDTRIQQGERSRVSGDVRPVAVLSSYEKATLERTVALVSERYLLVEDRCRSKRSRTFTTQVQTNGGAAKQRPLTRSGAVVRYETRAKRVQVCVGASASAGLSTKTSQRESSTGDGGPNAHEAIEYSASGREVRFLTAIAAAPAGGAAPQVSKITLSGGAVALRVESGGRVDVIVSNPGGAVQVPAAAGTTAFTTRHALTIVSFGPNGARQVLWTVGPGSVSF